MSLKALAVSTVLLTSTLGGGALAAPAAYTFSTNPLAFNTVFNPNGSLITPAQVTTADSIASVLAGTRVSGSFVYDSQARQTGITGGGGAGDRGLVYGGHLLPDGTPYSSFTSLAGSVNGGAPGGAPRTFTDPRGFTAVTNDGFQIACPPPCTPAPMVDSFEFGAESTTGPSIRNITGFGVDYRLFNVRMFWIETFLVPGAVPDLFDSESLPASPPSVNGRLALHFVAAGDVNGTGTQYLMFYDNVLVTAAVPEPQTYALLLAGLGLLGFAARRVRRAQSATR